MNRYKLRDLLVMGCVVFVASLSGIGLWLGLSEWRISANSAATPTPDVASGEGAKARPPGRPARRKARLDPDEYLVDRDEFYRGRPEEDIRARRLKDQADILESYEEDHAAFLKRYTLIERIFLFDAVIDGKDLIRVGPNADGGKWLSDPRSLKPGAVVYSFGAGTDLSFEADSAGLFGYDVHCFDPSPSLERALAKCRPGQPVGRGRVWYHAVGLGPVALDPEGDGDLVIEGVKCRAETLGRLAAELRHDHVDILKIDIEGGEMAALGEILASGTLARLSVKQLLVEFHLWDDAHWAAFVPIIGRLRRQGYLIFRKEFNPLDARCAEFCFLGPAEPRPGTPKRQAGRPTPGPGGVEGRAPGVVRRRNGSEGRAGPRRSLSEEAPPQSARPQISSARGRRKSRRSGGLRCSSWRASWGSSRLACRFSR